VDRVPDDVEALPPTGGFLVFPNPKFENNHGGPDREIGTVP
jgi:hypothetical protein